MDADKLAAAIRAALETYRDNQSWRSAGIYTVLAGDMGFPATFKGVDVDEFALLVAAALEDLDGR